MNYCQGHCNNKLNYLKTVSQHYSCEHCLDCVNEYGFNNDTFPKEFIRKNEICNNCKNDKEYVKLTSYGEKYYKKDIELCFNCLRKKKKF